MEAARDDVGADDRRRRTAGSASPTTNRSSRAGGLSSQTYTDTGAAGAAASAAPPATSEAVETAYPQNPNLIPAFAGVGIQDFGSDASKPYPNPSIPGSTAAAYPAGSTFTDGTAEAIPRYPTNIYYNTSTEAEEVDEFNSVYTPDRPGREMRAEREHDLRD